MRNGKGRQSNESKPESGETTLLTPAVKRWVLRLLIGTAFMSGVYWILDMSIGFRSAQWWLLAVLFAVGMGIALLFTGLVASLDISDRQH